jgi:hypothetical protein
VVPLGTDAKILSLVVTSGAAAVLSADGSSYAVKAQATEHTIGFTVTISTGAKVTINGTPLTSGQNADFPLSGKPTTIFNVQVVSEDAKTTTSKVITVAQAELPAAFSAMQTSFDGGSLPTLTTFAQNNSPLQHFSYRVAAKYRSITFKPSITVDQAYASVAIAGGDLNNPTRVSEVLTADKFSNSGATYSLSPGFNLFEIQPLSASGVKGTTYEFAYWISDDLRDGPSDARIGSLSLKIGAAGTDLPIPGFSTTQNSYTLFIPTYWPGYSDTSKIAFLTSSSDPFANISIRENVGVTYGFGSPVNTNISSSGLSRTEVSGQVSSPFPTNYGDNTESLRSYSVTVTSEDGTSTNTYTVKVGESGPTLPIDKMLYAFGAAAPNLPFPGFTTPPLSGKFTQSNFENAMIVGRSNSSITIFASSSASGQWSNAIWGGAGSSCTLGTTCTIPLVIGRNVLTVTQVTPLSFGNTGKFGTTNTITITRADSDSTISNTAALAPTPAKSSLSPSPTPSSTPSPKVTTTPAPAAKPKPSATPTAKPKPKPSPTTKKK